jgi:hypothetical protein
MASVGLDGGQLPGIDQFLDGSAGQTENLRRFANANKVNSHYFFLVVGKCTVVGWR